MKNQLKNYLRFFILLIGVSTLLWNCEKEEIIELPETVEIQKYPKINVKMVTLEHLQQKEILNDKLKGIVTALDISKNNLDGNKNNYAQSRISSTDNSFVILTDEILEVTTDSTEAYTFRLETPTDATSSFENFVIEKVDDTYSFSITKLVKIEDSEADFPYTMTRQSISKEQINLEDFEDILRPEMYYDYASGCLWYTYSSSALTRGDGWAIFWCPEAGGGGGGGGGDPNDTGNSTDTHDYDSNQDPDDNSDSGSGQGGGGSTGTNTTDSNTADPIIDPNSPIGVLPDPNSVEVINYEYSQKSPFDVDMTAVLDSINLPVPDSTKIANEKFLCVYDKLTTSNTFKNLFVNTFGDSDKFNVKFEIVDSLPPTTAGLTGGTIITIDGTLTGIDIIIKINKQNLISNSTFNIARTILHESIHAYLKLKLRDCNAGTTLDFINNLELGETINYFYDNFTCGAPKQSQHEFMFDYMLPTFQNVFTEVGNDNLTSQASIINIESDPLPLKNNPSITWSWQDFYRYFSMSGLHKTEAFKNEIENDSLKNDLFNAYIDVGNRLTKKCN